MAQQQTKVGSQRKISFGERKGGKARKLRGPKDKRVKAYRAQGRLN